MKKIEHTLLRKNIISKSLVSTNSQNWYGNDGNLIPWSGSVYVGPEIGDIVYNFTGSVDNKYSSEVQEGYHKWNGTSWLVITGITGTTSEEIKREINSQVYDNHQIPVFLESTVDEMGVMVSFDGGVEQVEQLCNFTYTQSGSTVTVYNSVNPDKLRKIVEQEYTINWGDSLNTTSNLLVNSGVVGIKLPSVQFEYTGITQSTGFTITITLDSPWTKEKITKKITVPQDLNKPNPMGSFTGTTLPLTTYPNLTGQTQNYLNDYEYVTGYTATPTKSFKFMAIGKSRINELKQYGTSTITGMSTGTTEGVVWSGYTIDNLYYQDFPDDYTMITGSVPNHRFGPTGGYTYEISGDTINTVPYITISGNTTNFVTEYVVNHMLTRNEHFLGFIDDPTVYSDIFVERGKQGVMEHNLRLGEIDNMSELDVYGNGYFNVKKQ
jgi:hypothetical protein